MAFPEVLSRLVGLFQEGDLPHHLIYNLLRECHGVRKSVEPVQVQGLAIVNGHGLKQTRQDFTSREKGVGALDVDRNHFSGTGIVYNLAHAGAAGE